MVSSWVLDSFPPANWQTQGYPYPYEFGTVFAPQVDCSITRLRWYRPTTNAGDKPDYLRVWDVATQTVLVSASAVPDDGAVGYQIATLDDPPQVAPGQLLIASIGGASLQDMAYSYLPVFSPTAAFPASLSLTPCVRAIGVAGGFPNNKYDGYILSPDAELSGFLPTASWTLVDTTSYTNDLKWPVPADKYRLNVTTVVQWRQANTVQGEDIRRVIGAWWPIADGFKGQRLLIDAPKSELAQPNGRRMDGLLLDTGAGSAGTVEAYVLS